MKLWTIQPIEFYNKLISNGEIYSSEKYANSDFDDAYKWIIKQMENRIGNRPSPNTKKLLNLKPFKQARLKNDFLN